MKPGLEIGATAMVDDVVTPSMQPSFEGAVVHPVYGTAAMVYHMEWAARRVILPFLEEDEEGVGTGIQVEHLAPASVGSEIRARAICTDLVGNTIRCKVEVYHRDQLLGTGEVLQRVYKRKVLKHKFSELWARK